MKSKLLIAVITGILTFLLTYFLKKTPEPVEIHTVSVQYRDTCIAKVIAETEFTEIKKGKPVTRKYTPKEIEESRDTFVTFNYTYPKDTIPLENYTIEHNDTLFQSMVRLGIYGSLHSYESTVTLDTILLGKMFQVEVPVFYPETVYRNITVPPVKKNILYGGAYAEWPFDYGMKVTLKTKNNMLFGIGKSIRTSDRVSFDVQFPLNR
jgi:hypothetical protein